MYMQSEEAIVLLTIIIACAITDDTNADLLRVYTSWTSYVKAVPVW